MTPKVLVFDVNETLIDIESIAPIFEQIFGDPAVMRGWFDQLLAYSMTVTASGHYVDFFTLGQGVLRMLATTRGMDVSDDDEDTLKHAMLAMPAHPDAADGLTTLHDNGFRLVDADELATESVWSEPDRTRWAGPSVRASVQRRRLPCLQACAGTLPVCMRPTRRGTGGVHDGRRARVGHHRAQSAGFSAALITRPGNAALPVAGLPEPTVVAADVRDLAAKLTHRAGPTSTG